MKLNSKQWKIYCMSHLPKVMTGKQWLTIEDWLECSLPLCALDVKHEGKIERTKPDVIQTVFVSSRMGGNVLHNGKSQVNKREQCFIYCPIV